MNNSWIFKTDRSKNYIFQHNHNTLIFNLNGQYFIENAGLVLIILRYNIWSKIVTFKIY